MPRPATDAPTHADFTTQGFVLGVGLSQLENFLRDYDCYDDCHFRAFLQLMSMCSLTSPRQALYPTIIVILVARHKTPLSDQLTSIEPLTFLDAERRRFLDRANTVQQEDATPESGSSLQGEKRVVD